MIKLKEARAYAVCLVSKHSLAYTHTHSLAYTNTHKYTAWHTLIHTNTQPGIHSYTQTHSLAASEDPLGVTVGGILGHAICTGAAVMGGRHLAAHINEKTVSVRAPEWCV